MHNFLHPEWKAIASRAWSMYGLYFMALLEAIDRFAPLIVDYSSPDWLKTVLLVLTIVVAVLRVMPQGDDPHVPRD